MMPKIVVGADVDNTLSFPNRDITEDNVKLCSGLEKLDIPVILSTGKSLDYAWRNASHFGGRAVFVENHAVWSLSQGKHNVYGPNYDSLLKLRAYLGISETDEGVCIINLNGQQGQVVVEEGKFGVLTLFTESQFVKHRWIFKQQWERMEVYNILQRIITENNLNLHVLEPHADGGIDVVRLDTDGQPIDKRSFPSLCRKIFPDVEKMVFLGDGINDLPAIIQPDVVGISFSNASKQLIKEMRKSQKGDIVTECPAPKGGPAEGIWRLAYRGFFGEEKSRAIISFIEPLICNLKCFRSNRELNTTDYFYKH